MPDQLTATGLEIDDYETRIAAVIGELRAAIAVNLDLSADQPEGQLIRIPIEHLQSALELLQELYSAMDPDEATGKSLAALGSITGTYWREATFGTVVLRCTLNGATLLPAGSIASVTGDPGNQWATDTNFTSPAGPPATYDVPATAVLAGVYTAAIGAITVIDTPVAGWTAVDNAVAATEGRAVETDTEFRDRRETEVTQGGSTSVDAIRAAISAITGVLEVFVYENDLPVAVAPMPPKSIEVVWWNGGGAVAAALAAEVREEIFTEKAGGIQAYGIAYDAHVDDQGNSHQIGYTLAAEQVIDVEVDINEDGTYAAGDIEDAVEAWADANLEIGNDVYLSQISGVAIDIAGVTNVVAVRIAIQPGVPGAADIAIGLRQVATIDSGDVTVTIIP